jgi:riboflavin kinase/FMN adenylyltransferase
VGNDHLSLEVHLLDFQGDLYDQQLTISFLHFLREERKFASLDELKKQIAEDIKISFV